MTTTEAALWLLLGSLVWLGVGTALLTAWGTRDELFEAVSEAVPGSRELMTARPWLFAMTAFVAAVIWPVTFHRYFRALPSDVRSWWRHRREARLGRKVHAHLERRTREFEQEREGRS